MTTPEERFRALCWAYDLLDTVSFDESLPRDARRVALDLRTVFPSPEQLASLIAEDGSNLPLPATWAAAIESAGRLFREIRYGKDGNATTRSDVLYTLRHYPLPGAATHTAEFGTLLSLTGPWIA